MRPVISHKQRKLMLQSLPADLQHLDASTRKQWAREIVGAAVVFVSIAIMCMC